MKRQIRYFSELRAFSCIAIVILHTYFCAVRLFQPETGARQMSMMVRNCMLFAVPCFVMVTGALLLDPEKDVPIRKIFTKYISRAAGALVVFTFIFALFDFAVDRQGGGAAGLIRRWLYNLVTDSSWLHMWYLYMLIGIYLMLPLWRAVAKHADEKLIRYILILFCIFQSVLPTIGFFTDESVGFYIMVSTVYPLYLFLGYAIHKGYVRISDTVSVILIAASLAVILVSTWFGIGKNIKSLSSLGSSYAFIGVVAQAAAVFSLMKGREDRRQERTGAGGRFLLSVDRCSFGIYLIHVLVLYTIYRVAKWNPYCHGGFFALLLTAAVTFAVSWAVTWLLKKVPGIQKIL